MKLSDLIKECGVLATDGPLSVEITSLESDSRKVVPGSLFVAVNGCGNDGRAYIDAAIARGAVAVMYEEIPDQVGDDGKAASSCPAATGHPVTRVLVESSRRAVAIAADRFWGHPSGSLKLVGITGTNGKTTTVTLL